MYTKFANLERILKKLANEEVIPPDVTLPPGFDLDKPMDDRARFTFKLFMLHQHYKEGNYSEQEYKQALKEFNKQYHKRNHEEWVQRANVTKTINFPTKVDERQKAWIDGAAHALFNDEFNYMAPMYGNSDDSPLLMHYISGVKAAENINAQGVHNQQLGKLYTLHINIQRAIQKYNVNLNPTVRDYIISKLFRRINLNTININDLIKDMEDKRFMIFLCIMCGFNLPKYIENHLTQRMSGVTPTTLKSEFTFVQHLSELMDYLYSSEFKNTGFGHKVKIALNNYKANLEQKFPIS